MSLLLHGKQMRCHGFARMRTGMRGVSVATLLTIPEKKKGKKINGAAAAVGCSESPGSQERLWAACEGVTAAGLLQVKRFLRRASAGAVKHPQPLSSLLASD